MIHTKTLTPSNPNEFSLLLVDDNAHSRELIALQLKRSGYAVTEATCGQEALSSLEEQSFDLILLDIMMPGMSGIEVLEQIRKTHSMLNLPIIMVTADDLEDSIVDALQKGANDYLIKPLNLAVTFARIKTQLALKDLANLKDEFVRFASHDLQKPLIVTMDIVETLQRECKIGDPISEDSLELVELIHKTGKNMQKVITGFLDTTDLNRETSKSKAKFTQINKAIEISLSNNSVYAKKKGIKLTSKLESDLPDIEVDEFQITQVVDNLIGNAVKFSPANTETVVSTYQKNGMVYTAISDGGPGLKEEDLKMLFNKNAKLSNLPTGGETSTGIGLIMSKQFIDSHHGRIGAQNNPNKGTTFWIGLPVPNHTVEEKQ